jgi:hypothetical protein
MLVNQAEEISNLVSAAEYLPGDYVTRRILTLFGDTDKVDEVLNEMSREERISFSEPNRRNEQPDNEPGGGLNGEEETA